MLNHRECESLSHVQLFASPMDAPGSIPGFVVKALGLCLPGLLGLACLDPPQGSPGPTTSPSSDAHSAHQAPCCRW